MTYSHSVVSIITLVIIVFFTVVIPGLLVTIIVLAVLSIIVLVPGLLLVMLVQPRLRIAIFVFPSHLLIALVIPIALRLNLALVTILLVPGLLVYLTEAIQYLLRLFIILRLVSLQVVEAHEVMNTVVAAFLEDLVIALVVGLMRGWRGWHDEGGSEDKKKLVA